MIKGIVLATLLCSSTLTQAVEQEFHFSHTGFYYERIGAFDPTLRLDGEFIVDDRNNDGVFALDEVIWFRLYDIRYNGDCSRNMFGALSCADSFSYSPGGALSYHAWHNERDDPVYFAMEVTTGDSFAYAGGNGATGTSYGETWRWTDATRTVVSAVPEPSQFALYGIGLAGLLAVARRRRP